MLKVAVLHSDTEWTNTLLKHWCDTIYPVDAISTTNAEAMAETAAVYIGTVLDYSSREFQGNRAPVCCLGAPAVAPR